MTEKDRKDQKEKTVRKRQKERQKKIKQKNGEGKGTYSDHKNPKEWPFWLLGSRKGMSSSVIKDCPSIRCSVSPT